MWKIESVFDDAGAPYDRKAAVYDRLVRSRTYNRIAWSATPQDYADFAGVAFSSAGGPLLEIAAGSAAATARLHAHSQRPTVLLDLSSAMLERAARRITAHGGGSGGPEIPPRIRFVQADLLEPPFPAGGFTTILGLGLTHLFDDLATLVAALRAQLTPGGRIYLAGLVSETRRGRRYLDVLHRAGEVARPKTSQELRLALGGPANFWTTGCMAYATLEFAETGDPRSA